MYAASGYELRRDWYGGDVHKGRHRRLAETLRLGNSEEGILAGVANTDFLHAVSLFHVGDVEEEGQDVDGDEDAVEAALTIS